MSNYEKKSFYALKYLPKRLTKKDKILQRKMLDKSRKLYKKGKYYTRKIVSSYSKKISPHILHAQKIYKIEKIMPSKELAIKTGCTVNALSQIEKKGQGAYYSSGSRPNQTAHSWGRARLASAITAGKSAAVDFSILEKGCKHNGKAFTMALKAKEKHGYGHRKVPKV